SDFLPNRRSCGGASSLDEACGRRRLASGRSLVAHSRADLDAANDAQNGPIFLRGTPIFGPREKHASHWAGWASPSFSAPPCGLSLPRRSPRRAPPASGEARLHEEVDVASFRWRLRELGKHPRRNPDIDVSSGRAAILDPQLLGRGVVADRANA